MIEAFNKDSGDYCKIYILTPQEILSYYGNYGNKIKKKNCKDFIEYYNALNYEGQIQENL